MKNVKKLSLALCFAATVMTAPVFAQVESKAFYSNGFKSTAETIRTDTENFIDVRYFDQVMFDKLFLTTNFTKSGFNLGGATKVKDFYLAGLYSGGFWYNLNGSNKNTTTKESKDDLVYDDNDSNKETLNRDVNSGATGNTHRTIFMVGFPNKMGLKLDTYLSFNASDKKVNEKKSTEDSESATETIKDPTDKSKKEFRSEYEGNLVWSCFDLAVGKVNIKPWARVGVDMYDNRDISYYKTINKTLNPDYPNNNVDTEETYNKTVYYNSFYPLLNINLGSDFAFNTNEKFNSLVVLNYGLSSKIYADMDTSVETTKFVDKLNNKNNWSKDVVKSRSGKVDLTNSLKAMYKFEAKPMDKLTLSGRVGLDTSVNYYNPGKYVTKTTEKNVENSKETKVTVSKEDCTDVVTIDGKLQNNPSVVDVDKSVEKFTTTFVPTFGLGVAYAVKPNFVLNLGYSGYIPTITIKDESTSTVTTTTNYDLADPTKPVVTSVNKSENNNKNVTTTTGSYNSTLSTGFTWNIANCCALDCAASISRTPSLDNVWNAGWNLGFTFKK